ncbi:hypothetical protein DVZ93_18450 [Vibrio cholerae]|nr:hypothetical protein [Vibrio cholerae]
MKKYIATLSFIALLSGCGGENSGLPSQGGIGIGPIFPQEPRIIDASIISLEKFGDFSIGNTIQADSNCIGNGCSTAKTIYQWVVDINDDGVFDDNDLIIHSESFTFKKEHYGHKIKLIAKLESDVGESSIEYYNIYDKLVPIEIITSGTKHDSTLNVIKFNDGRYFSYTTGDQIITEINTDSSDIQSIEYSQTSAVVIQENGLRETNQSILGLSDIDVRNLLDFKHCGKGFAALMKNGDLRLLGDFTEPSLAKPQAKIFGSTTFCASIDFDGHMTLFTDGHIDRASVALYMNDIKETFIFDEVLYTGDFYGLAKLKDSGDVIVFGRNGNGACEHSICPQIGTSHLVLDYGSPITSIVGGQRGFSMLLENGEVHHRGFISNTGGIETGDYGQQQLEHGSFSSLFSNERFNNQNASSGSISGYSYAAERANGEIIAYGSEVYTNDYQFSHLNSTDVVQFIDDFEQMIFVEDSGKVWVKNHDVLTYPDAYVYQTNSMFLKGASANRASALLFEDGVLRLFGRKKETGSVSDIDVVEINNVVDVGSTFNGFVYIDGDGDIYFRLGEDKLVFEAGEAFISESNVADNIDVKHY